MNDLVFAAVADDDTGASDLAGMLAEQDVRTLLIIDLPSTEDFLEWSAGYQAVIMAVGTRNLPPAVARKRTREAIRLMEMGGPRVFQIKYCSTFDSTPEGNIGPSIDAALDELDEEFTIALPALPVNGRTTYMGYHFVHQQLLSDSPMRAHPLTPMTNPNLVDLLGRQTARRVGLIPYPDVARGVSAIKERIEILREQNVAVAIVDCLNDKDLETICRATATELRLVTGSSALAMKLPAMWREREWLAAPDATEPPAPPARRDDNTGNPSGAAPLGTHASGCLVVAGSCSVATREQNKRFAAEDGTMIVHLDAQELLTDAFDRKALVARMCDELKANRHCLLTTTSSPDEVRRVQEWWSEERGLSIPELGAVIAYRLADLTLDILSRQVPRGLVAAGGETSGALCRRLELGALRVGRNIDPGVPLCFSLGRFKLPVVLKSGNFGSPDFYRKAAQAIMHNTTYFV